MNGLEEQFLNFLSAQQPDHPRLQVGPGDDMAVIANRGGRWLMSSDMLLDGVHFDTHKHGWKLVGRKAMACALSDCAAMAVQPVCATISVACPKGMELESLKEVWHGAVDIAGEFKTALVGGDTTSWSHPFAIDVAIMAEPFPGLAPIMRQGAKTGDKLYVTGKLGGSLEGHHLGFTPRVYEAKALAEALASSLHAMIDISDGLSLDLFRMCKASGVGAVLDEAQLEVVISDDARRLAARDGKRPLDHVLADGEDFELLFAVGSAIQDIDSVEVMPVGEIGDQGLYLKAADGTSKTLEPHGFLH